jgi:hypothetical protein
LEQAVARFVGLAHLECAAMTDGATIEAKFWKALKSDMTVMLGVDGEGDAQPTTAQLDGDEAGGPIWFFTSTEIDLAKASTGGRDDPKLQLLRFDPGKAQIWLNERSLFGFKPDQDQAFHGARFGWQKFVGNLEEVLAR